MTSHRPRTTEQENPAVNDVIKLGRHTPTAYVDPAVVRDTTLSVDVRLVYAYLATFTDQSGRINPPHLDQIADQLGMSRRKITAALNAGERAGLWSTVDDGYLMHDFGGGYQPGAGTEAS